MALTMMAQATALLDRTEEHSQRLLMIGLIASLAGALLLMGFSSDSLAVVVGGAVVLGGPLLIFLKSGEQTAKQAVPPYLAVIALFLVADSLAHHWGLSVVGRNLGWIGLLEGLIYTWAAFRSWQLLGPARDSLNGPAFDVRLEVQVRRGYVGAPYTDARLWRMDSDSGPPLAQFGVHWSTRTDAIDKVPAQVHSMPLKGSVVAVSTPDMALIGRIRNSHFAEPPSPPRAPSALVAWLWKPRSLRIR
jgi:hypothetical protein